MTAMREKNLRQIADAVAIHVMEWEPWVSPVATNGEPDCWLTGDEENPTMRMRDWNPAEEIGDAWQGVEALRRRGIYIDVRTHTDFYEVMATSHAGKAVAAASDPSLPKALCKVFLRAVGVEVPEDA